MKQTLRCAAFGTCLFLSAVSFTAEEKKGESGKPDSGQKFVKKATDANLAEINHGNVALQQAADAEVRQFAQRMVTDHSMANQELIMLADRKNIRVPQEMSKKHREMQEKLTKLRGAEFDRVYMKHMVHGHKEAVSLFENETKMGQDADLKAFAAKTLPKLQEHLTMAQKIAEKTKKDAK